MKLGDAFRWGGHPPKPKVLHLYFVISDPAQHGGSFVVVNITLDDIRAGRECILRVGDHPWITKESFVSFGDARLLTAAEGNSLVSRFGTEVIAEDPLDPEVRKRIVEAAKVSTAFAPSFKQYL